MTVFGSQILVLIKKILNKLGNPGIAITYDMLPENLLTKGEAGGSHLQTTLRRIDQIANEDVEMRDALSDELTLLVIDTNILLHHFETLQQFVGGVESLSLPVVVVIPGIVICELDGQKNRDGLAWFARRASQWLLRHIKERRTVKGQANEETCKPSRNWKVGEVLEGTSSERANDYLIFDCCQYFHQKGNRTFLCSADKNLCIECEVAGIPTITVYPRSSSRDIAATVLGDSVDLRKFTGYQVHYNERSSYQSASSQADDGMDIDDDKGSANILLPSHALDLLHIQVIEHFTMLLVELVTRVDGSDANGKSSKRGGTTVSRHAPSWAAKDFSEYVAGDCLGYLQSKGPMMESTPRLDVFLSKPYTCRGARRGQDWSPTDWIAALTALAELGDTWKEPSILESLNGLQPHLTAVFSQPMRPTGIGHFIGHSVPFGRCEISSGDSI